MLRLHTPGATCSGSRSFLRGRAFLVSPFAPLNAHDHQRASPCAPPSLYHAPSFPGASCLSTAAACKKPAPPPRSTPVVAVAKANRGPLPYVVNAPGQVEPARTVAVQSQVSGMLTRVAFNEGDEVRQGQVLFEID